MLLGVIPFAFICGVVAIDAGFTIPESIAMNSIIFAGASQLIVAQLLGDGAPVLVVILSAFVVNLRFAMYSASLSPHLSELPFRWRTMGSYMLSDQAYGVSIFNLEGASERPHKQFFFLGAAFMLWSSWQVGGIAGVFLGKEVPDSLGLDFAVPLTFMALIIPALKDRGMVAAAVVGGLAATFGGGLPLKTGLLVAACLGICAGLVTEKKAQ